MIRACIAALCFVAVQRADAKPAVRLAVRGDCPTVEQLAHALETWLAISDDPGWTIEVSRAGGTSRLAVRDRGGAVALSRELASRDCAAVAEAFAVMVHGHFVELRLLPPRSAPGESDAEDRAANGATVASTEPAMVVAPRRALAIDANGSPCYCIDDRDCPSGQYCAIADSPAPPYNGICTACDRNTQNCPCNANDPSCPPACNAGDPNCPPKCNAGDPNCQNTPPGCNAGDPNCQNTPPGCNAGDPNCRP